MNTEYQIPASNMKWKNMSAIVRQYQHDLPTNISQQYKKMTRARFISENVLVLLLQFIGLMMTTLTTQLIPVWFATGTACAFVYMRGKSTLPGIWLGSLVAYTVASHQFLLSFACASILALQAGLFFSLGVFFISPTLIFDRVKSLLTFLTLASILSVITAFALMAVCYGFGNDFLIFAKHLLHGSLANLNGIFTLAFAIVALDTYFPQADSFSKVNKTVFGFLYGLLFFFVGMIIFSHDLLIAKGAIAGLFLITMIISFRYGWCGAVSAIFFSGFIVSLSISVGVPVLQGKENFWHQIDLQFFLLATTLAALLMVILYRSPSAITTKITTPR